MGQPQKEGVSFPQFPEQSKTVFYIEAEPAGILVIRSGRRYRRQVVPVGNPQAALDWCLANGAGLVFARKAADITGN